MGTIDKLQDFARWMNEGFLEKDMSPSQVFSFGSCVTSAMMSQFSKERGGHNSKMLRASQLGKPAVVQALDMLPLGRPGESIGNKLRQIFFIGETYECFILEMLQLYGFRVTGLQQEIEFHGTKGHIDAILDDDLVIEVKTMSAQYASKFKRTPDDERGYLTQLAIYSEVLGLQGAWVTFDKGTSTTNVVPYPEEKKAEALSRAQTLIELMPRIKTFKDIFELLSPPEPIPYVCKRKETDRFVVPPTLQYNPWRHVFYKIETQKDCYSKPREFVIDYTTFEEAIEVFQNITSPV